MTEAQKHTLGPWTVDLSDDRFVVRDANDDVVADCWNGTIGDEGETPLDTCEPNARLIAAAPDMLAALNEVAILGSGRCTIGKPLAEMIRAAIAKAEGR